MSADNWTKCWKCIEKALDRSEQAAAKCEAAYGKVAEAEYKALCEAADKAEYDAENPGDTLREDYDIEMNDDGTLEIEYFCRCSQCGFCWSYTHSAAATEEAST